MQGRPGQDPLAQLNDIRTPDDVSIWPLDWGWWLVIVLVVVILAACIVVAVRHYRYQQARRTARKELATISASTENWPARLNTLLKRTALAYCPQDKVASLYGEQWQLFLKSSLPESSAAKTMAGLNRLSELRYQATVPDNNDFNIIYNACEHWLKRARFNHIQEHNHV